MRRRLEGTGRAPERLSKWAALKAGAKVTPKAARVGAFIIFWAVAMKIEGLDEFSITEYQRYWHEGSGRPTAAEGVPRALA